MALVESSSNEKWSHLGVKFLVLKGSSCHFLTTRGALLNTFLTHFSFKCSFPSSASVI